MKKIDDNINLYFCKNCGTFTLLINEDEQKLLNEYEEDDDLIIEEYDIEMEPWKKYTPSIQYKEFERINNSWEKDYYDLCKKYYNLIFTRIIKLSSYYKKTDDNTLHITCEYLLNKEVDVEYLCMSKELLEKIPYVKKYKDDPSNGSMLLEWGHGLKKDEQEKEIKRIVKEVDNIRSKIKCQLCSSTDIILLEMIGPGPFFTRDFEFYIGRDAHAQENIDKMNKTKQNHIKNKVNKEMDSINNEINKIEEISKNEKSKINIQELLTNMINTEKNIQLLKEELKLLLKKKEEQKASIVHFLHQIKILNLNCLSNEDNIEMPIKPEEPEEPKYRAIGFFSKKTNQEYNEKVKKEYDKNIKKYEEELLKYNKEVEKINKKIEKNAIKAKERKLLFEEGYKKLLNSKNIENDYVSDITSIFDNNYKKQLDNILSIYKTIENETEETKQQLLEWSKIQKKMIALNVLFPKYNNLVAWTTINEYFITGRVSSLEGPQGAYNLFESETRNNIIIDKLESISNKLDDIKKNQYMLYEVMGEISNGVNNINKKMDVELTLSALTAYNTERAARYAKLTSELAGINLWLSAK